MCNFQEKKMILLCLYEEMLPRCNLYMKTFSCFGQMVLFLNFKFLSSKQNREIGHQKFIPQMLKQKDGIVTLLHKQISR